MNLFVNWRIRDCLYGICEKRRLNRDSKTKASKYSSSRSCALKAVCNEPRWASCVVKLRISKSDWWGPRIQKLCL